MSDYDEVLDMARRLASVLEQATEKIQAQNRLIRQQDRLITWLAVLLFANMVYVVSVAVTS